MQANNGRPRDRSIPIHNLSLIFASFFAPQSKKTIARAMKGSEAERKVFNRLPRWAYEAFPAASANST